MASVPFSNLKLTLFLHLHFRFKLHLWHKYSGLNGRASCPSFIFWGGSFRLVEDITSNNCSVSFYKSPFLPWVTSMRIGLLTILHTNFNISLGNLDYFKENKVFKFYNCVFRFPVYKFVIVLETSCGLNYPTTGLHVG